MQETLWCEVIGCNEQAVWVRTTNADATHEDALCGLCWSKLGASKPNQAAFYASCIPEGCKPAPRTLLLTRSKKAGEAVTRFAGAIEIRKKREVFRRTRSQQRSATTRE